MNVIKVLHVMCVFIWIGNLLALTRFMGYHVKEEEKTQMRLAKIYRRMNNLVTLPAMGLSIIFGAILLWQLDSQKGLNWFFFKMLFAVGLMICSVVCMQFISDLNVRPAIGRGVRYKILHGVCGLLLIGVLVSIYVLR